jgi:hypothetical protein
MLDRSRCALFLALFLAGSGVARSSTLVSTNLEDLTGRAELIFVGTAVSNEVVPSADGKFPFSFTTFRVEEVLKGRVGGKELTLRFHGGILGQEEIAIAGMPEFAEGERYLLFVRGNGTLACPIVGWVQGQLRFVREPRSGALVLADYTGAAVEGVGQREWARGRAVLGPERTAGVSLVAEDGARITAVAPARPAASATGLRRAEEVLGDLRTFLKGRALRAGFVAGRVVGSARTDQVPEKVEWAPTAVR